MTDEKNENPTQPAMKIKNKFESFKNLLKLNKFDTSGSVTLTVTDLQLWSQFPKVRPVNKKANPLHSSLQPSVSIPPNPHAGIQHNTSSSNAHLSLSSLYKGGSIRLVVCIRLNNQRLPHVTTPFQDYHLKSSNSFDPITLKIPDFYSPESKKIQLEIWVERKATITNHKLPIGTVVFSLGELKSNRSATNQWYNLRKVWHRNDRLEAFGNDINHQGHLSLDHLPPNFNDSHEDVLSFVNYENQPPTLQTQTRTKTQNSSILLNEHKGEKAKSISPSTKILKFISLNNQSTNSPTSVNRHGDPSRTNHNNLEKQHQSLGSIHGSIKNDETQHWIQLNFLVTSHLEKNLYVNIVEHEKRLLSAIFFEEDLTVIRRIGAIDGHKQLAHLLIRLFQHKYIQNTLKNNLMKKQKKLFDSPLTASISTTTQKAHLSNYTPPSFPQPSSQPGPESVPIPIPRQERPIDRYQETDSGSESEEVDQKENHDSKPDEAEYFDGGLKLLLSLLQDELRSTKSNFFRTDSLWSRCFLYYCQSLGLNYSELLTPPLSMFQHVFADYNFDLKEMIASGAFISCLQALINAITSSLHAVPPSIRFVFYSIHKGIEDLYHFRLRNQLASLPSQSPSLGSHPQPESEPHPHQHSTFPPRPQVHLTPISESETQQKGSAPPQRPPPTPPSSLSNQHFTATSSTQDHPNSSNQSPPLYPLPSAFIPIPLSSSDSSLLSLGSSRTSLPSLPSQYSLYSLHSYHPPHPSNFHEAHPENNQEHHPHIHVHHSDHSHEHRIRPNDPNQPISSYSSMRCILNDVSVIHPHNQDAKGSSPSFLRPSEPGHGLDELGKAAGAEITSFGHGNSSVPGSPEGGSPKIFSPDQSPRLSRSPLTYSLSCPDLPPSPQLPPVSSPPTPTSNLPTISAPSGPTITQESEAASSMQTTTTSTTTSSSTAGEKEVQFSVIEEVLTAFSNLLFLRLISPNIQFFPARNPKCKALLSVIAGMIIKISYNKRLKDENAGSWNIDSSSLSRLNQLIAIHSSTIQSFLLSLSMTPLPESPLRQPSPKLSIINGLQSTDLTERRLQRSSTLTFGSAPSSTSYGSGINSTSGSSLVIQEMAVLLMFVHRNRGPLMSSLTENDAYFTLNGTLDSSLYSIRESLLSVLEQIEGAERNSLRFEDGWMVI